jgi:hypothetical protein
MRIRTVPTTCPRCASDLDLAESLCARCGWNAPYLVRRHAPRRADASFTERYRGTAYDSRPLVAVAPDPEIARGRMFVIVSFASLTALAAAIVLSQPPT